MGLNYREHRIDLEKAMEETVARIADLDFNFLTERRASYPAEILAEAGRAGKASWKGCGA